jgi:hypothetical protein
MWFVTGWIRGKGDSCRQQSPEFPLVNLGILTAGFYKHCHWQWPSDSRSMRVGCSCGSEEPLVLVYPYLEMLDSDLKVSCLLLIQHTGSMIPGEICYKVYWLATIDPCIADSPENLLSPLKRLSLWHIPQRWYYPSHIGKCTGSLFCIKEELFSL